MEESILIQQKGRRFEFLDGLRSIAACLVVWYHFNDLLKVYAFPNIIDLIFNQGRFGVEIFFVLSGFVIAYSLRKSNYL